MYASDTRNNKPAGVDAAADPDNSRALRRSYLSAVKIYAAITAFVWLFGAVYEHFSFGVYSVYMQYAFTVPLLLGLIPAVIFAAFKNPKKLRPLARKLWHDGIAVLTVGSLFTGVLHIYGTSSGWSFLYAFAGAVLMFLAILLHKEVCPGEAYSR